ncbi:MAG: hypothetical protein E7266_08445 [Lachnospiraceae bacterium]|nr:hypothetical protein [Lachnospiraceae bacterium]
MEENKNKSPHKVNTVIFIILFLIAILFEIYWIMTYPEDIFMLIGIGLVAIIMGFFAFEGIMDTYMEVQKQRYEQNEMLIKTQKALYLATKKNSAMLETKSEQNIEAIKYLVLKMSENQQQMTNLIRENNEEMAKRIETSGSDFSSSDISQLVDKLAKSNERLTKEVQAAVTVNELVKSNAELVKSVKEVLGQSVSAVSSLEETPAFDEMPVADEVPVFEKTPIAEEIQIADEVPAFEETPIAEEIQIADEVPAFEETPIAEEIQIADEVPAFEETPIAEEIQLTDEIPVVEEVPEVTEAFSYIEEETETTIESFESEIEIEETTSEEISESEVEETPAPEPSPFEAVPESNGLLSEDEIAALFANL